ncbi:hypothetical protein QE370_000472 [Aeromicrobium sp. SORGH_AS981]|uniref:hypothetical protein n=1 Tax=Aeromicrobium sp. SORGH_AS_0981 TaxID=3041802 RepID=UPI0028548DC8|nr:hypothetical protein [Aeromicrobium sp. SORGH_AS_0981]MDR6117288.1 hypothetical protein [Aeromicrobium sp. SORGH_AS_0981]
MELTTEELRASVYASRNAVVLDQCCTVEQKHTVLLGRIGEVRRLPDDHQLMVSLRTDAPSEGVSYSKYFHLLEPTDALADKPNKVWVVELVERVSIGEKNLEDLQWLTNFRQARMTPQARARLRARLVFHFANSERDDQEALASAGLDEMGLPKKG